MSERQACKADGCEKLAVMRGEKFAYGGFCSKHYQEQRQAKKAGRDAVKAEARGDAVSEKPVKAGKRGGDDPEEGMPEDFGKRGGKRHKMPFGWCIDGNHSHCKAEYIGTFGIEKGKLVRCICDCHDHAPVAEGVELA